MKALLLIAHGSRREASNEEVRQLAKRIQQHDDNRFDIIKPVFLELAKPGINEGVDYCLALGVKEITALPYMLAAGRHVAEDIPAELAKARDRHPQLDLKLKSHLGAAEIMDSMVLASADSNSKISGFLI